MGLQLPAAGLDDGFVAQQKRSAKAFLSRSDSTFDLLNELCGHQDRAAAAAAAAGSPRRQQGSPRRSGGATVASAVAAHAALVAHRLGGGRGKARAQAKPRVSQLPCHAARQKGCGTQGSWRGARLASFSGLPQAHSSHCSPCLPRFDGRRLAGLPRFASCFAVIDRLTAPDKADDLQVSDMDTKDALYGAAAFLRLLSTAPAFFTSPVKSLFLSPALGPVGIGPSAMNRRRWPVGVNPSAGGGPGGVRSRPGSGPPPSFAPPRCGLAGPRAWRQRRR